MSDTSAPEPQAAAIDKRQRCEELADKLDALAKETMLAITESSGFRQAFALGLAINELRAALDSRVMQSLSKLQNTKLGFLTDSKGGYPVEIVRDCIIHAASLGLYPTGNQFNIIGGNMYVTKEGVTRLLQNLPKLSRLKIITRIKEVREGLPARRKDGSTYAREEAVTEAVITCMYGEEPINETLEFVIRVNAGMGADAVLGKCERKAKGWLYNYLTGFSVPEGEAEQELRDVTPRKAEAGGVDKPALLQEPARTVPGGEMPAAVRQEEPLFGRMM